jgi:hypothetical protein
MSRKKREDEDSKGPSSGQKTIKKWTGRGLTGGQVHPYLEIRKEERMQQVSGFPSPGYKSMQTAPRVSAASTQQGTRGQAR